MAQNAAVSQSDGNGQRTIQQFEYNARGQIVGVVDGNRNPLSYDVDSWGCITGIGFADSMKERYEYTPAGQVSKTTDGNGNSVQYRYNSLGKVSERTDQMGYTETFQYDEGNLSLHIDRDGRRLQGDCNVFGKPVYEKATDAAGKNPNISTWHYDSLGRVIRAICDGHSYEYIYDTWGHSKEKRSSGRRLISYTYDKTGQVTEIKDPAEVSTHYEYDENGHITAVTDQNGSRYLENAYDETGRVVRQNFSSGVYQTFTYDDANRRNTVYYSESGKTETYEFNDRFLKERVVYDDGTCETYLYSEDSLKTGETSRLGHRREWAYDAYGRTIREKSPDGYEVCHEYDENHDLVRTWDTEGRETQYAYDDAHNQILVREKISGEKWRETAKEYDSMGRCIVERDALGNETLKEYDPNRAYPSRVTTPKGEETAYSYDAVGRRMSISNSYGMVEMAYNSRNFVTSRTDGEGHTTRKFYDRMGNLTSYYPPVQWEKKEGGYEYRRDFLERVVDTISPLGEHQRVFRNFDGDIINKIHPVSYALKGDEGEGTRYEYNANGNCIRIRYPDGGVERRFYDADGNMVKQVRPESYDAAIDDGAGYRYAYDSCGRLTEVRDPDGNVLHTYAYNGHGQITGEVDGEGKETLYTYNGLGWKIREQVKVKEAGKESGNTGESSPTKESHSMGESASAGAGSSMGESASALYRVIAYFYDS